MGQDPYATYCNKGYYATGRAFEMAFVNTWTDLIKNDYGNTLKEVMRSIFRCTLNDLPNFLKNMKITPKEWFDQSEKEGVIWINSALTVKSAKNAQRRGRNQYDYWNEIMPKIVAYIISKAPNLKEAFALGDNAQKVLDNGLQNAKKSIPITVTEHPTNDQSTFYDSDIFSKMKKDINSFDSKKI